MSEETANIQPKTDSHRPETHPLADPILVAEKVYELMKRELKIERERRPG
jgi:hypothetical protein